MLRSTMQRIATPTAILVGLSDDLAEMCQQVLADGAIRVLRVGHVAAAAERIPVTMPQLIVVSTLMPAHEFDTLNDRCVAVGAEVLRIDPDTSDRATAALVRTAARNALLKALGS
ncbi:MAG: hypothetical protein KIT84_12765 [Labilithrix sp.]|nr:hypothetical protein [Labilithrix sp.]MCW5811887.1 hypothetical protein [Labilithrix sp.]